MPPPPPPPPPLLLLLLLLSAWGPCGALSEEPPGGAVAIPVLTNLTVDYVPASRASIVEGQRPTIRWVIPREAVRAPGTVQRSYRLQVWQASGAGGAFDSGVVTTTDPRAMYTGAPRLRPDATYSFSVDVTLSDGTALRGTATFRTGLQSDQRSAWGGAEWIAGDSTVPNATAERRNNLRSRVWTLDDAPSSATAFVAGIGYHELYCNGVRQGLSSAKLQPGFTNFEKRTYYVLYSLTSCLKKGANVLGVELGNGWYSAGVAGSKITPGGSGMPHARLTPPQLLLRARATVGHRDVLLVSNEAWLAARGPVVEDSLYNGEIYDARRELKQLVAAGSLSAPVHFSSPHYILSEDSSMWMPVSRSHAMPNTTKLVPQLMPPIQKIRALPAKSITEPVPGIFVVDFGQNSAGIVSMKLPTSRLAAGQNITLYHAELLNHPPYTPTSDGRIYTHNLRHALARDVYISNGQEPSGTVWEPTFTQHGFRYIEIHHWPPADAPDLSDFTAWEMHTGVQETGTFASSSPLLNQIQSNCQWTARSNLMSVPTDCCQRDERRGWMGDAALGASVNTYNHDMHTFYSSFAMLMTDDQGQVIDGDDAGSMPNWVPVYPATKGAVSDFPGPGSPNWMTAFPTIVHTVWKHTGDNSLVERHWPHLLSYLGWFQRKLAKFPSFASDPFRRTAAGAISNTQFPGDWCPPPKTQGLFRNDSLNTTVDIASGLGEAECGHTGWNSVHSRFTEDALFTNKNLSSAFSYLRDKQRIAEMGKAINATGPSYSLEGITTEDRTNFLKAFYSKRVSATAATSVPAHFGGGGAALQSENVMALLLQILPPDEPEADQVLSYLLSDIMVTHRNHSSSGIVGLRAMLEFLPSVGRADVALAILLRRDYPSFGYEATNALEPATTMWELYDAPQEGASMNSRNHVMFATPSYFFFSAVAGVEPVRGDKLWRVAPAVVGSSEEVNEAGATVWTVHGSLSTGWHLLSQRPWQLSMNVTAPVGLEVDLALPLPQAEVTSVESCVIVAQPRHEEIWRQGKIVGSHPGIARGALTHERRAAAITLTLGSGEYRLQLSC